MPRSRAHESSTTTTQTNKCAQSLSLESKAIAQILRPQATFRCTKRKRVHAIPVLVALIWGKPVTSVLSPFDISLR